MSSGDMTKDDSLQIKSKIKSLLDFANREHMTGGN